MTYQEAYAALQKKEKGFVAERVISYKNLFLFTDKKSMSGSYDNWLRSVDKNNGKIGTFYINPSNIEDVLDNSEVVKIF